MRGQFKGLALVFVLLFLPVRGAFAGAFGGFSRTDTTYADGSQSCTPGTTDDKGQLVSQPACAPRDKKSRFQAPRGKGEATTPDGAVILSVKIDGDTATVLGDGGDGPLPLLVVSAAGPIKSTRGPFVSADGQVVALEVATGPRDKQVVGATVTAALAVARRKDGPVARLEAGKTWVQAAVACKQPRVTMSLARGRKFTIKTESTCQGLKDVLKVSGTYKADGERLVLVLPGDEGDEFMACTFEACTASAGPECLHCASGGDGFEAAPQEIGTPSGR